MKLTEARARDYITAILVAVLAILIRQALDFVLGNHHVYIILILAVLVTAWLGGLGPALVTLFLTLVAAVYLFIPTRYSVWVTDLTHQLGLTVYLVSGIGVALLGEAQRAARQRLEQQAAHLEEMVRDRTAALSRTNAALQAEVAERRRAEEREREAAVELRRSNEELEKFAYVASHDLQEPLRKIQAFGDRLSKRCRDQLGEQGSEYLDRILSSAGRMRRLIDDLLVFSRVATKTQPFIRVDLNDVLAEVVADLEIRISQVDGRVDVGPLPTIDADPTQMRQLFQNLLGNALKFHAPDVPPVVQISALEWDALPAGGAPPRPAGQGWRITVTDNGIGFEQQFVGRIFEVFQRLHGRSEFEGTGIGLAICRKIVERHGGAIAAHSEPGHGATFFIDLPAASDGTATATP